MLTVASVTYVKTVQAAVNGVPPLPVVPVTVPISLHQSVPPLTASAVKLPSKARAPRKKTDVEWSTYVCLPNNSVHTIIQRVSVCT